MTKTKSTKRALLMSALALLMCVSMLIGSTYAWFTDSVTSSSNIIKSGKLGVGMYWAEGDLDPETVTDWKDASQGAIFTEALWEPGYTEAKHIKIANEGNLALKYQMRILANGVVSVLANVIDVYYLDEAAALTRNSLASATKLGTLSEVLNNTNANAISKTISGSLLENEAKFVTIAFKMQETAGNEYQDLSIGTDFSIQLLATQYTYESDSFDEKYDANADFPPQENPSAMVYALSPSKLSGITIGGVAAGTTLDTGYSFQPTETHQQALKSEYSWAHADFFVYSDALVPANSMALAGYYKAFDGLSLGGQTLSPTNWIGLTADFDIAAGKENGIRLIADGLNGGVTNDGITIPYNVICELGNDGTGFLCGATDLTGANSGATLTVELRLYKTYPEGECPDDHGHTSKNCETGEYITVGTTKYTYPAQEVDGQAEMNSAIANGASAVELSAGTYTVPSAVAGRNITIKGSGDSTVFDFTKINNASGASITFENLKITGKNSNTMDGYGIQGTTGDIVYKNCTFENAVTSEFFGNVSYIDCEFIGTYYIATYSVKSATFENCVFNRTDSRAILVYSHGPNPVEVTVKDCEFKAAAKGYTGVPEWTAAIEVDTTNITPAGTTVTVENCTYDANYNGIVRDKSADGKANAVIKVDGVTVDNLAIRYTGYAG